jgi:hypothetical protein
VALSTSAPSQLIQATQPQPTQTSPQGKNLSQSVPTSPSRPTKKEKSSVRSNFNTYTLGRIFKKENKDASVREASSPTEPGVPEEGAIAATDEPPQEEKVPVFGTPLNKLALDKDGELPEFVVAATNFLETKGTFYSTALMVVRNQTWKMLLGSYTRISTTEISRSCR